MKHCWPTVFDFLFSFENTAITMPRGHNVAQNQRIFSDAAG
jgi:hypothetical protein